MYSYFFIPGHKLENYNKIENLGVDEIIIDLEDAVKASDREKILERLMLDGTYKNDYVRIPLYDPLLGRVDTTILKLLLENGFRKFVFPKVASIDDFSIFCDNFHSFKPQIILLVESPRLLLDARDLLMGYKKHLSGIAVGSHDFMNIIGGKHTLANLEYFRFHVLYLARMIDILAIDIASMEMKNSEILSQEIKDGAEKGFDAKFFIHPWQIEIYKQIKLYSLKEYEWALKIHDAFENVKENKEEFNPVIIDGEVIEKPHLKRAIKILNYYKNEGF